MAFEDKCWDITIKVRVCTMSGWKPDDEDITSWLERGDSLELLSVENIEEVKS